jgi:hypothetical protein
MRFITTSVHGVMDYTVGMLLIVAPWLFEFDAGGAETWVPVGLGAAVIFYSLLTNYELGVLRRISMPVHLGLDAAGGLLLALSPWLLQFSDVAWIPHAAVGLLQIAAALMTETRARHAPATAPAAGLPGH